MDNTNDQIGRAHLPAPAPPPARADLVAILARVSEDYPFEAAIEGAAQLGLEVKFTWYDPTTAYEEVWEHPAAAAHNAALDRRTGAILDSYLFKLYELGVGRARDGVAPWLLVVGTVGNTMTYEIWPA